MWKQVTSLVHSKSTCTEPQIPAHVPLHSPDLYLPQEENNIMLIPGTFSLRT